LFGFSFHSEQKVLAINIWKLVHYKLFGFLFLCLLSTDSS
jgi:hypothetical protein